MEREIQAENYAKINNSRFIILSDRSAIEPAAYIGIKEVRKILKQYNKTFEQIQNSYDLVVHIVTAANGASKYYSLENNFARDENVSEAISIDNNLMNVWKLHHCRYIADNNVQDFDEKIEKIQNKIVAHIHYREKCLQENYNEI